LLLPIGLLVLWAVGASLRRELPLFVRRWLAARVLARNPGALLHWEVRTRATGKPGVVENDVVLRLRDGRRVAFDADADGPLVRWLEAHARPAGMGG
jgi:hypothetical protein